MGSGIIQAGAIMGWPALFRSVDTEEVIALPWYGYLACFIAGVILANGVPHFVQGASGKSFPSPFASPPGIGKSSPVVNVLWGSFNFILGFALIVAIGGFAPSANLATLMFAAGAFVTAIGLSIRFGSMQRD